MLSSLKYFLGEDILGGSLPQRAPKFCPNNCLTNNFLLCEFQLSMAEQLKSSNFGGFAPPPREPPNLFKIIVLRTTFYIVSFNFLCQAVQNGPFFSPHFEGKPFDVELNKNNMQTTPCHIIWL